MKATAKATAPGSRRAAPSTGHAGHAPTRRPASRPASRGAPQPSSTFRSSGAALLARPAAAPPLAGKAPRAGTPTGSASELPRAPGATSAGLRVPADLARDPPRATAAAPRGLGGGCAGCLRSRAQERSRSEPSRLDLKAFNALVERQHSKLAEIKRELDQHGRKTSHWAWWVFPTDKEGNADPYATRVTEATAGMLLAERSTAGQWRTVLERICDLVEADGVHVLPSIDHGRVFFFIRFWQALEASPEWMQDVCHRMGRFEWSRF